MMMCLHVVQINDEHRLKMMYHRIWFRKNATMFVFCLRKEFIHKWNFIFILVQYRCVRLHVNCGIWILILCQHLFAPYCYQVSIKHLGDNCSSPIVFNVFSVFSLVLFFEYMLVFGFLLCYSKGNCCCILLKEKDDEKIIYICE